MRESSPKQVVAAFDFDGTLTYRDTLLPFILFSHGWLRSIIKIVGIAPVLSAYLIRLVSRQKAKESVLTAFFYGRSLKELKEMGAFFAEKKLPQLLKPEGIERLRWHQKLGHRCILVSASVDLYLDPWAKAIGFDDVISSKLALNGEENVTGKLEGLNCRAQEKVRRLEQVMGPKSQYELYAYGDSAGDKELLAYSDHPFYRTMPREKEKRNA